MSSRVGANHPKAWDPERWRRELVADIPLQPDAVAAILDGLDEAYRGAAKPVDVRDITDRLRDRLETITAAAEKVIDENPPPHVVYVLTDAFGDLLYVGITDRGPRRLVEHERLKPWWPRVATVNFERHPSREIALAREEHLIRTRHPRYNIVHNLSTASG